MHYIYKLQELELVTSSSEGFGFSLAGGVDGPPANPTDPADHGVFISKVYAVL